MKLTFITVSIQTIDTDDEKPYLQSVSISKTLSHNQPVTTDEILEVSDIALDRFIKESY